MQQIVEWLQKLGLGQYANRFAENDITFFILPDLTDQDLEKIGVASLGHRRQLLRAISELKGEAEPSTVAAAPVAPHDTAERRQVTVMFSDLVGSTALSARMDPEDLREVISAYQTCVAETVRRFGGFIAKYMGDGVLIYFGYPQAHEDDAERAVRAGLDLVAAVSGLKTHAPLQTRIGIATGLVVVGDLIGSGASQEQAIVGETPNLAARLQGVAEPNSVVIAEGTRKLVGSLFEVEDLGSKDIKGISGPVRAWAALRPSSVESRFEALHAGGVTALVGREEELELLLRRWSRAKTAEGQVVLLSGEPGIGKSRLTAALLEGLAPEPHTRLRYFCSPQHTDSALYPTIGQMERAAGLTHDDTPKAKLDKLDAVLARTWTSNQDAALFAEMLSLPNDGRYSVLNLAPEQRRRKTLEALISQLEALTRPNPVLMIFEDAHWADPTSLDVLGRVVDRIANLPVLLIVTFRPEFDPPWIGQPHVTALTINRLTQRDVGAMIDRVVGNKLLPADVLTEIIERTDGIPLFVEEMTKAVLEAESKGAARRMAATIRSPGQVVPASLHASLMARLDRLGPVAKDVAQKASVIGRDFAYDLLLSIADRTEPKLREALDRLTSSGLLFARGAAPQSAYIFKHALVQDAAYGTLLLSRRQELHARVAAALETQFPEVPKSQPELLAHHLTEARLTERAIDHWLKAGQRALARSAMVEGEALVRKGLTLASSLSNSVWRRERELDLQMALGRALVQTQGFDTQAAFEAFSRARELCDELKRPQKLLPILYGQWVNRRSAADLGRAQQFAAEMLHLGEMHNDVVARVVGYRASGATSLDLGDFPDARAYLEQGLALYDPTQRELYAELTSINTLVALLGYLSPTLASCGYLDQARSRCDEALAEAREVSHAPTLAHILWFAWDVGWCARSEPLELLRFADELFALSTKHKLAPWHKTAIVARGWCLAALGRAEQGISLLTNMLSDPHAANPNPSVLLAEAYWMAGQPEVALMHLAKANATQVRRYQCEALRIRGELLMLTGDCVAAEASFRDAVGLARQQTAKLFELRSSSSLARLWRDQGNTQQARELLAPVYDWFTEGFDTRDLKEAKALLEELTG